VLLVTYYFPPAGGGGVQRVLSWCRHLGDHGIDVTVLAPEAPQWVDEDTTLVVPGDVSVVRTPDPSPPAVIPADAIARARGPVAKFARRVALQPRRFAVPDIHRAWRRPAVRAALAVARTADQPWDVVISSSPPETTHLVAHDIARALGVPWVADYRDSWLDLPHLRMDKLAVRIKHRRNARLATKIMRAAAAATTVSEPLARDLRTRHPQLAVTVLENGVEFDEVDRALPRAAGFRDTGRFVISYTGNFFGRQSPAAFLDGLERACQREPEFARDVLMRFVGGMKPRDEARIADSELLSAAIERHQFLRHDDVLATQAAADLLLLYVAPGRGSQGVYTGKVFEYVAARRPVFALAPADNVATALLGAAGSTDPHRGGGRVDPDDVEGISAALLDSWRHWLGAGGSSGSRVSDVPVPDEVLDRIDRRTLAGRLAELLHRVSS
jgi:glycosyltransferase involved in cell wall biosynthesis